MGRGKGLGKGRAGGQADQLCTAHHADISFVQGPTFVGPEFENISNDAKDFCRVLMAYSLKTRPTGLSARCLSQDITDELDHTHTSSNPYVLPLSDGQVSQCHSFPPPWPPHDSPALHGCACRAMHCPANHHYVPPNA